MKKISVEILRFITTVILSFALISCGDNVTHFQSSSNENDNDAIIKVSQDEKLKKLEISQKKNLVMFGKWQADSELTYMAESFEDQTDYLENVIKFSIFNSDKEVLYQQECSHLRAVYSKNVLGRLSSASSQLFLIFDYGGSDIFLKILSTEKGKVVSLIADLEGKDEFQFSGDVIVLPAHYSKDVDRWKNPSQILVTGDNGSVTLFGYKSGKYQVRGKLEEKKLIDFIEKASKQ